MSIYRFSFININIYTVKNADRDTRAKRGREENDAIQESIKVEDEAAAGQQPNFLFQSEAQPSDNRRRLIRRRNAARRFRVNNDKKNSRLHHRPTPVDCYYLY